MAGSADVLDKKTLRDAQRSASVDNSSMTEAEQGVETGKETLVEGGEEHDSRHSRSHSISSDDSDPLSPLEHALTPDLQVEDERVARELTLARTTTSIGSNASRPPDYEVTFETDDPENPKNWPFWYRSWVVAAVSFSTWVVVLYSTSYTASIPGLMVAFGVENQTIVTLGVTTYLLGLAAGSIVVAPMSELYGRRPTYIICMAIFALLVIPCGLATSLSEILVVRFFG